MYIHQNSNPKLTKFLLFVAAKIYEMLHFSYSAHLILVREYKISWNFINSSIILEKAEEIERNSNQLLNFTNLVKKNSLEIKWVKRRSLKLTQTQAANICEWHDYHDVKFSEMWYHYCQYHQIKFLLSHHWTNNSLHSESQAGISLAACREPELSDYLLSWLMRKLSQFHLGPHGEILRYINYETFGNG